MTMAPEERPALGAQPLPVTEWDQNGAAPGPDGTAAT
jgi:hypothetical protein